MSNLLSTFEKKRCVAWEEEHVKISVNFGAEKQAKTGIKNLNEF
jgi:hypothetical protein